MQNIAGFEWICQHAEQKAEQHKEVRRAEVNKVKW